MRSSTAQRGVCEAIDAQRASSNAASFVFKNKQMDCTSSVLVSENKGAILMDIDIASYVKTAKSVITANSPVLLLGTTIAGVVTTGVLAAKAGYKARGIVDEAEGRYNMGDETIKPLTPQEKVQLTWSCYATTGISAAGTIAAAVGTHTIHTKRANAMAALYAVTSNKLDDMTEKAEKMLGPKKTQQLQNEVAQKQIERNPIDSENEVLMIGGTELCYDEWSGRYFMSSMQKIEEAINDINRTIIDYGDVCLNEFYDRVGLPGIPMGDTFGWSGPKIEGRFGAVTAIDGRPAISVGFRTAPKDNLGH